MPRLNRLHIHILALTLVFSLCLAGAAHMHVFAADNIYKNEKYKRIPAFEDIDKEVDRLLLGITKKINARFDPYGNEIRRHMARVGAVDVMVQATARVNEYENIKTARQIFENWKTHMGGEIIAIEKRIDTYPASEQVRLNLKLEDNLKVIASFYQIMDLWLEANYDLLTFLQMSQDEFDPINPAKGFKNKDTQDTFHLLLEKRNDARDLIRAYPSFADMLY